MLVGVAGYRVRAETGANGAVVIAGMAATAVVLGFFVVDTLHNAPETFAAIVAIAALAVVLDAVWKRLRSATSIQAPASQPSPSP
jgi:ABC-type nitrate/sulfonate/bicarbonate transport system permease component